MPFSHYHLERQEECVQFVGALQYLLIHAFFLTLRLVLQILHLHFGK